MSTLTRGFPMTHLNLVLQQANVTKKQMRWCGKLINDPLACNLRNVILRNSYAQGKPPSSLGLKPPAKALVECVSEDHMTKGGQTTGDCGGKHL